MSEDKDKAAAKPPEVRVIGGKKSGVVGFMLYAKNGFGGKPATEKVDYFWPLGDEDDKHIIYLQLDAAENAFWEVVSGIDSSYKIDDIVCYAVELVNGLIILPEFIKDDPTGVEAAV